MKKGYIPKDQRKKILLLSDDIRTQSGVGHMAQEIVNNTSILSNIDNYCVKNV